MKTDMLRKYGQSCLLLSVMLLMTQFALGQNANTGEIKGTATDSTGAVVSGVTVTITNVQTGVNTVVTTNGEGIYDVPAVTVGRYKVTFSKTGFRNLVRDGITL